ncbi:MAG: DUF2948 family protein [Holosporaceae bacterium]|nr:DUF2948 family protein [Holosporaceae bacterium]
MAVLVMNQEFLAVKASCSDDCDLLSSLLQDSIFHISFHSFHGRQKCLRLMLNRFCWESVGDFDAHQCYFRVHSGLYIYNVNSVVINDNFRKGADNHLNLLTLRSSENEINLIFSDHKHLRVSVKGLSVYLKDLHDRYPTSLCPSHENCSVT